MVLLPSAIPSNLNLPSTSVTVPCSIPPASTSTTLAPINGYFDSESTADPLTVCDAWPLNSMKSIAKSNIKVYLIWISVCALDRMLIFLWIDFDVINIKIKSLYLSEIELSDKIKVSI